MFLILDNHNSHTSTKFLNACRENNVTPLVLPPHTLHILQPFDSFCFVNVIRAYSEESNKNMNAAKRSSMNKANFLEKYELARNKQLTSRVIIGAWKQVGLADRSYDRVLNGHHVKKEPKKTDARKENMPDNDGTYMGLPQVELDLLERVKQEIIELSGTNVAAFDELVKSYRTKTGFIQLLLAKVAQLEAQLEMLGRPAPKRRRTTNTTSSSNGLISKEDIEYVLDAEQESIQRIDKANKRMAQILKENPSLETEVARHS